MNIPSTTSFLASGQFQSSGIGQLNQPSTVHAASNEHGNTTFYVAAPPLNEGSAHIISGFQSGKDTLNLTDTLKNMGVPSLNFNHSDPSELKNPGDAYLNYDPKNNHTNISVLGQPGQPKLNIIVEGQVKQSEIEAPNTSNPDLDTTETAEEIFSQMHQIQSQTIDYDAINREKQKRFRNHQNFS